MGVYTRKDSPYFWLCLERPGQRPLYEATRIRADAPTPYQRKDNRQLAEFRYHERMTQLARADYQLPGTKPRITFDAYADWYEAHYSAHKKGREREHDALKVFRAAFGPRDLASLTRDAIVEWRTQRVEQVSVRTAERELSLLKHVLTTAVPTYLEASPIARLPQLTSPAPRMRILTPAQEAKILAELQPADRAIVVLALDTLMRLSDVVNLRREDDHGDYVRVHDSKVGTYEVPLSRRARAALDAVPDEGPFYFPTRRRASKVRDHRSSVKSMFRRACERAGVPYGRGRGITFHGLRHTGASRMIERGVDVRTVQAIGGWKSLQQLSRYTHPTDEAKRRAVEAVSNDLATRMPEPPKSGEK